MNISSRDSNLKDFESVIDKLHAANIQLVPVRGKIPTAGDNWQTKKLSKQELLQYLKSGTTGLGVMCGEISNGLVVVDFDCKDAYREADLRRRETGEIEDPATPACASGLADRVKKLYRVPREFWPQIRQKAKIKFAGGGALELLWSGSQAVIPPSLHPDTKEPYFWVSGWDLNIEIAQAPMWVINALTRQDTKSWLYPLPKLLSLKNKEFLDKGGQQGDRNDSGASLIRDLIGCQQWLEETGIPYSGDAQGFLHLYGDKCTPPLDKEEVDQIYKSAEKGDCGPSKSDSLVPSVEKYYAESCSTKLAEKCRGLLGKSLQDSDDNHEETRTELSELMALEQIPCPQILPDQLFIPLSNLAKRLNLPVEAYVSVLLSVASSQLNSTTRLAIDPYTGFYAPPIFWLGVVGESGSKKSPLIKALTWPLDKLQNNSEEEYERQLEDYENDLANWEESKKGSRGKKPKEPAPREHYLSDFTTEALGSVLGLQKQEGLLVHIDELARFFSSMDAYRSGKGGDRQHWLSFYDGGPFKSNRKVSGRVYSPRTSISLVGGIQPSIIQKIMFSDTSVDDGLWPRFAWVKIPMSISLGISGETKYDLTDLLQGLYKQLGDFTPERYRFSPEAENLWDAWHFEVEKQIIKEPSSIIRATLPKAKERAARIALVCHLIHAAMSETDPEPVIQASTLAAAIRFTQWLMAQTRSLYGELGIADSPETAKILKFIKRFQGCGWVTARMVVRSHTTKAKPSAVQVREFMAEVVKLGYAIDNGESGSGYKISICKNGSDSSDKTAVTITEQRFRCVTTDSDKCSDNGDKCSDNLAAANEAQNELDKDCSTFVTTNEEKQEPDEHLSLPVTTNEEKQEPDEHLSLPVTTVTTFVTIGSDTPKPLLCNGYSRFVTTVTTDKEKFTDPVEEDNEAEDEPPFSSNGAGGSPKPKPNDPTPPSDIAADELVQSRHEQLSLLSESYELLDPSNIQQWSNRLLLAKEVALDIETFSSVPGRWIGGKNPRWKLDGSGLNPREGHIRLIQLHVRDHSQTLIIELSDRKHLDAPLPSHTQEILTALELVVTDSDIQIVGHNLAFDLSFLRIKFGWKPSNVFDTQVASRVLHNGKEHQGAPMKHNLKEVVKRELGVSLDKSEQTSDWGLTLNPEQLDYATKDVAVLIPLKNKLLPQIQPVAKIVDLENACLSATVEMNCTGFKINTSQLAIAESHQKLKVESAATIVQQQYGLSEPVLKSPTQLKEALKAMGLQLDSTCESALTDLDHPIAALILDYRSQAKKLSSISKSLPKALDSRTGRVHSNFKQTSTTSGRYASSDTNIQNVDRDPTIRSLFIAGPGNQLVIADYSQIELRIAAEITQDKRLLQAYRNGEDVHALTAAAIAKMPLEEMQRHSEFKQYRQMAKAVNFGFLYGMGTARFVAYAKSSYGVDVSLSEAEAFRKAFLANYQGIQTWHKKIGSTKPSVVQSIWGRPRKLNRYLKGDELRYRYCEALNHPVQATGADMLKRALVYILPRLSADMKLVSVVHDEIILEAPSSTASSAKQWLVDCMVGAGQEILKSVPVEVEAKVVDNWAGK